MTTWEDTYGFYGPNAGYALELYDRFQNDPNSLDPETRAFFTASPPAVDQPTPGTVPYTSSAVARVVAAARLARSIREYGHLAAGIDPLGGDRPGDPMLVPATHRLNDSDLASLPGTIVWPEAADIDCLSAITRLRAIYCGALGYEFDHVNSYDERLWLHEAIESEIYHNPLSAEDSRSLLERLSEVEGFEKFLQTTFPGQKRFSLEGLDMLIPVLDALLLAAAMAGTREVIIGMAHRGRLNVLAHILQKPVAAIFSEFHTAPDKEMVPSEGSKGINFGWTGDVKYHLGAEGVLQETQLVQLKLTLAHNPSHLEFVNPVIAGAARASQEDRAHPGAPTQQVALALPVAIHGDAAFPGEGVVAETLNLSRLPGYQTGGTIHIILNNQVGFTTEPQDGRSTLYASDVAKGFEIPIIHVNADDPRACLTAIRLAHAYRARFHKDFLVDLIGYRRWGHNEGDEPAFTQPHLVARIANHPTVRELFARQLEQDGIVAKTEATAMQDAVTRALGLALEAMREGRAQLEPPPLEEAPALSSFETGVPGEQLLALNEQLLTRPEGFSAHARLERTLLRRRDALSKPNGIDWALAESLAFGSLLMDGTPIRLTGQDTERGTFSQRHLVLHDTRTSATWIPLQALSRARATFAVYNSPLSESAPLGFEYGFSVHAPEALVLWEAQFGDFANVGQVLIDQFIAAARAKWRQLPSLVLLLPHGYEGQGPDHSSGRVERFLQLAAEDNLRIANATTAAQYFHLLRAQAATLGPGARPLVVMTPKSLLRHPAAASSLEDLVSGHFRPVLDDAHSAEHPAGVERIVLCSGKVAIDLLAAAQSHALRRRMAIVRLEQLYPFPERELEGILASYPWAREMVWLQEEPHNMGAWTFMAPRLQALAGEHLSLRYAGRPERASTAEGQAEIHALEQARLIEEALAVGSEPTEHLAPPEEAKS